MIWLGNFVLNSVFDLVLRPFRLASPWPGLIAASCLVALVLIGLFALSSDAHKLRAARNRLLARTLELLLFQHDLRVSLTACGRILAANAVYLWQFFRPMLVGLVPLVILFVQLEAWFDRRPLQVGEFVVLVVDVASDQPVLTTPAEISLSENLRLDSPVVRTPTTNQLAWRVSATAPGSGWAEVTLAGVSERKTIVCGDTLTRTAAVRVSRGVLSELFAPSEPPLDSQGPLRRLEVGYPARQLSLGLTDYSWVLPAFVLMMVFSLILGKLFGVQIA